MNAVSTSIALRSSAIILLLCFLSGEVFPSGNISSSLLSTSSQADYVIISPPAYVSLVQSLASHRASYNGFTVRIVTTDSIYAAFGQGVSRDSAVRAFITFALTSWSDPKPQYFLLAGNINTIPSHKEQGLIAPPDVVEDSIMVDEWLVEGVPGSPSPLPSAALGRLPAWTDTEMATMVAKLIAYDGEPDSSWSVRAIFVADYSTFDGTIFEDMASSQEQIVPPVWHDTITVHIRQDSPLYRTKAEFVGLLNQGSAIVSLVGHTSSVWFSESRYFSTADVDSLSNGTRLPLFVFEAEQQFDKVDTPAMAVALLGAEGKGAVAAIGSSGLTFANAMNLFYQDLFLELVQHPDLSIGAALLNLKRQLGPSIDNRKRTLLGDPALVIKHSGITVVHSPSEIPSAFVLYQNYPNPFNPTTTIRYALPNRSHVTLTILNILGQQVAQLVNEDQEAGFQEVRFDGAKLSSGVYFYRIQAGKFVQARKLLLLK